MEQNEIRKIGIIDLGTNSVRFDVQKIGPGTVAKCLHREKQMVRLGEGVFRKGKLDLKASKRTLHALERFKRISDDLHVNRIVAFGTSTLREVSDSGPFLQQIKQKTGIDLRIISGEEEAKLIASAILSFESKATGKFALVDIGGGSTEISLCRDKQLVHCVSFPLGAARLQQVFLKQSPPAYDHHSGRSAVDDCRTYVHNVLLSEMISEDWPKVKKIIGSSGTIRAVSKIMKAKLGTRAIRKPALVKLVNEMSRMDSKELLNIPGMEPKRVDMILSGAILLEQSMEALGAKIVYPTEYALRDGILMQEIDNLRELKLHSNIDLFPLFARACRLGCQEASLKELVINAELLFDRLRLLHKLENKWKNYLLMAMIFRDTGWTISPVDHEKHSYYIVKNVELPVSQEWEIEFVAMLCLCINGIKPDFSMLGLKEEKKRNAKKAFDVLLAIMKVCDALGPAHQEKIRLEKVSLRQSTVQITVRSAEFAELAKMRLQQHKDAFEKFFKRKLSVDVASLVPVQRRAS